jgi:hypothetical protein
MKRRRAFALDAGHFYRRQANQLRTAVKIQTRFNLKKTGETPIPRFSFSTPARQRAGYFSRRA